MNSTVWSNPIGGSTAPLKRFGLGLSTEAIGGVDLMLNAVARALQFINGGQTWRYERNLMARPEVSPDAYELSAVAMLSQFGRSSTITLEAVSDYRPDRAEICLVLTYALITDNVAFWKERSTEEVVAVATLTIADLVWQAGGFHRPPDYDPCTMWQWYEPSCGWFSGGKIMYGGWSIKLGG